MNNPKNSWPKRPREHVIGNRAESVFRLRARPEWAINRPQEDYGWDVLVTIVEDEFVKEDFFVQLKGSDNPMYIDNKKVISQSLKTSTVQWLLGKPVPSMLCVCDTSRREKKEPVYWVWIQEAIKEISKKKPNWKEQRSISYAYLSNIITRKL